MSPAFVRGRTVSSLLMAALAVGVSHAAAQGGPGLLPCAPFRWSEWEIAGARPDSATLDSLGICPHVAAQPTSFHWMDADGDGLPDLVFSGPTAWCTTDPEGSTTAIYLNRRGSLVLAIHEGGAIAAIWRPIPGQPVSLLLEYSFGERLSEHHYILYTPAVAGDSVVFRQAGAFAIAPETRLPDRLLAHPVPFAIPAGGEPLPLRTVPDGADSTNAVLTLEPGSRGIALAERRDTAGRTWWFVRMDAATYSETTIDDPMRFMGWVPARGLNPLREMHPRRPVDSLAPFQPKP